MLKFILILTTKKQIDYLKRAQINNKKLTAIYKLRKIIYNVMIKSLVMTLLRYLCPILQLSIKAYGY
jgi:hypothetical protein